MLEQHKNRIRIKKKSTLARRYPKSIPSRLAPYLFFGLILLALPAIAQLPGMESEPRTKSSVADTGGSEVISQSGVNQPDGDLSKVEEHEGLLRYWQRFMGEDSPYRSLILVILTLAVLLNLKAYLTRVMRKTLKSKAFTEDNPQLSSRYGTTYGNLS